MNNEQPANLGNTSRDIVASLAKGTTGMVPIVGPLIAEVVGNVIPSQRVDRIVRFVELLEQRLGGIEKEVLQSKLVDPQVVDILEDSFTQAARATTQERLEHIANVVANGITPEDLDQAQVKRMLWLLGQLTDEEIVILRSKLAQTGEDVHRDAEFRGKHEQLLAPDMTHMGSAESEFEQAALKSSYRQHLFDLGLVRHRYRTPRKGELPEFDDRTGTMKSSGSDVTKLGRMLLHYVNLVPDWYRH